MKFLILSMVCGSVFGTAPEQTQKLCSQVLRINCVSQYMPDGQEELCGTDGRTYSNTCHYVQAKCKNISLDYAYGGHCRDDYMNVQPEQWRQFLFRTPQNISDTPTITETTSITPSPDVIDITAFTGKPLCSNDVTCPNTLDPICGSDDFFYLNICTFEKAKCKNPDLKIQPSLTSCRD